LVTVESAIRASAFRGWTREYNLSAGEETAGFRWLPCTEALDRSGCRQMPYLGQAR
jgi:hypothetical protein